MPSPRKLFTLLFFALFTGGILSISIAAEEEESEESTEEETVEEEVFEPLEKLVFVESYLDGVGGVDGVDGVYSVVVSPDGKHIYLASMNDDAISIFSRNESSGRLTFAGLVQDGVGGIDCLNGARSLTISPDGKFVYVVSMFSDSLASFARDSGSGALNYLGCILDDVDGVDGLDGARSVCMSPSGDHLYVAGFDDESLSIFQRNFATGEVSFLGRLKEGEGDTSGLNGPHYISMSPDGKNIYIALWDEDAVSRFTRDVGTGLLTYENKYENGVDDFKGLKGPRSIVFSPKGEFVYVASWNDDTIVTLSRDLDTGELAPSSIVANDESGVVGIDGPHSLVVSAEGKFVYVASFFDDALSVFSRNEDTGELVYDQSLFNSSEDVEKLNGVLTVAISADAEHVYTASLSDRSLVAFSREIIVDPPVFSVHPLSKSIPFGASMAFDARADGFEVSYQWQVDGVDIPGETSKVLNINSVAQSHDQKRYSVVASNQGGSVSSDEALLTVLPPVTLDAPRKLTALATSDKNADLVWMDDSDNETGFEIQRKTSDGTFDTVGKVFSNTEAYSDGTLQAGTTYIFRVRATKGFEISDWSNESVIESFDSAPNGPKSLAVEESTYSHVRLVWTDFSAVEDGFRIQRTELAEPDAWTSVSTVETSIETYTDWSVLAEKSYLYRVSAYNESGESEYSNTTSAVIESNPVTEITPERRTVTGAESESNLVSVTASREWEVYTNSDWIVIESPIDGQGVPGDLVSYKILENEGDASRQGTLNIGGVWHYVTQESYTESFPVPSLDAFSINEGAEETMDRGVHLYSSYSASVPTEYRASEVGDMSGVEWVAYEENPTYQLSAEEGVKQVYFQIRNDNGVSTILSDLITYKIEVVVTDPEEPSDPTDPDTPSEPEDPSEPEEPKDESATELISDTRNGLGVLFSWLDNSDTEDGYVVERSKSSEDNWEEIARLSKNSTEYLDETAVPGESYKYRVYPIGGDGVAVPVVIDVGIVPLSYLSNMSTRAYVGSGDDVMIVGFVRGEGNASEVYLRSIGPELEKRFSVKNTLQDPSLVVVQQGDDSDTTYLVENEDWGDVYSPQDVANAEESVSAFSISDSPKEAVAALNISKGIYTAIVSGEANGEGVALAELYSFDGENSAPLLNLSTRGRTGLGEEVMAGGFVISGDVPLPVLIRGLGPSLAKRNVQGALTNPEISLYREGEDDAMASNDDWGSDQRLELLDAFSKTGAGALDEGSKDAAILIVLQPGAYACILNGVDSEEGVGLFEVFVAR